MTTLPETSDLERFHMLYTRLEQRVLTFIAFKAHPSLDPQDIAQSTWLKVWLHLPNEMSTADNYVLRIAHTTTIDAMRNAHIIPRRVKTEETIHNHPLSLDRVVDDASEETYAATLEDGGRDFTEKVEATLDLQEKVERTLALLSTKQRTYLLLHVNGYSNEEIAAARGMRADTVKSTLYRGRDAFRARWKELDSEDRIEA